MDVQEGPARNNPGAINLSNAQEGPAREEPGAIDLDIQEGPARNNPGAIDLNNVQEGPAMRFFKWASSSKVHLLQMRSQ